MEAYCTRVGAQPSQVRFLFDGERLNPDQTPAEVRIFLYLVGWFGWLFPLLVVCLFELRFNFLG